MICLQSEYWTISLDHIYYDNGNHSPNLVKTTLQILHFHIFRQLSFISFIIIPSLDSFVFPFRFCSLQSSQPSTSDRLYILLISVKIFSIHRTNTPCNDFKHSSWKLCDYSWFTSEFKHPFIFWWLLFTEFCTFTYLSGICPGSTEIHMI